MGKRIAPFPLEAAHAVGMTRRVGLYRAGERRIVIPRVPVIRSPFFVKELSLHPEITDAVGLACDRTPRLHELPAQKSGVSLFPYQGQIPRKVVFLHFHVIHSSIVHTKLLSHALQLVHM